MKKDSTTSTMLVISTGFVVLYLIFAWRWTLMVSLVIGLIGIFPNALSKKIEWLWMKLARVLSYIVPSLLMGIIFYLLLFPLALLSKLFTKDPLLLSNKYKSYFVDVEKPFDKRSLEKIW